MPADITTAGRRYTLWVSDKDENGAPIDPQFIEAASELEQALFAYRRREIGCESVAADLVQASVNAASRAPHAEPIQDARAYLFTTFRRKVDQYLAKVAREVSVTDHYLEQLARERNRRSGPETLEERVLAREVRSQMDDWTRKVAELKTMGFSMKEIAEFLREPTNRINVRYSRGLDKARDLLKA
jgi:DNA-directed RNA polymerase specialized sigma24 family protein